LNERARLDLKELRTFVEVADVGGFRRAAQHLDVRQSVLSRRVSSLEDQLGVSLFERHRGGVRLTHAGERLLDDLRPIFLALEGAITSARAAGCAVEGRLRAGVAASLSEGFLRRLLETWLSEHPCVLLEVREGDPRELLGAVLNRRLDVTFLTGSTCPPGCDAELLWSDSAYAAVQHSNPFASRTSLPITALAHERFILSQGGFGPEIRDWLVKRLSNLGVSPRVEFVEVSREVLLTMVGLGFGITLTASLETGVSYPNAGEQIPFSAVWSPENDNPALRRFLSLARVLAKREANAALRSRTHDPSP
jgi:DNA-binding transcriptional LysR family regulator